MNNINYDRKFFGPAIVKTGPKNEPRFFQILLLQGNGSKACPEKPHANC